MKPFEKYKYNLYKKFNHELTLEEFNKFKEYYLKTNILPDKYLNINCEKCKKCYLCYNCVKCYNCNNCIKCDNCKSSTKLVDCINCYDCNDCDNCNDCNCCVNCNNYIKYNNQINIKLKYKF